MMLQTAVARSSNRLPAPIAGVYALSVYDAACLELARRESFRWSHPLFQRCPGPDATQCPAWAAGRPRMRPVRAPTVSSSRDIGGPIAELNDLSAFSVPLNTNEP